jgi:hypothetical protein
MWKQHLVICVALALLAIPLYVADYLLLRGGGGGWISLDFRGLIIVPYLAFLVLHVALSSLALAVFPAARLLPLHLVSGAASIGLLVVGFLSYSAYESAQSAAAYKKRMEIVEQLRKVIELREWWYAPNDETPTEIHLRVKVNEAGRFSGNAQGRAAGDYGEMIFNTERTPQRQAVKGEEFVMVFPLNHLKAGKAESVSISLYLFKDDNGTAPENVSVVFEDNPATGYDGHFIYKQIPPRTTR